MRRRKKYSHTHEYTHLDKRLKQKTNKRAIQKIWSVRKKLKKFIFERKIVNRKCHTALHMCLCVCVSVPLSICWNASQGKHMNYRRSDCTEYVCYVQVSTHLFSSLSQKHFPNFSISHLFLSLYSSISTLCSQ